MTNIYSERLAKVDRQLSAFAASGYHRQKLESAVLHGLGQIERELVETKAWVRREMTRQERADNFAYTNQQSEFHRLDNLLKELEK